MTDLEFVLGEFRRLSSSDTERDAFFAAMASNVDMQNAVFNALGQFIENPKAVDHSSEAIRDLARLLLKWYRRAKVEEEDETPSSDGSPDNGKPRSAAHLIMQFLPQLIGLSLITKRRDIDSLLLAVYNQEATNVSGEAMRMSHVVASLSKSSIYHDSHKIGSPGCTGLEAEMHGHKIEATSFPQISRIVAQNRPFVNEALLRSFNSRLGDMSKNSLERFISTTQKLLQRGYNTTSGLKTSGPDHRRRIVLSGNILLELLYGAYFCIYNGLQSAGSSVVELIRQRGAAQGATSVLITVNSVKTLVLSSGPSQLPATSITTPSQIAKNLITNASFRAKKMGDDIPKVEKPIAIIVTDSNPTVVYRAGTTG